MVPVKGKVMDKVVECLAVLCLAVFSRQDIHSCELKVKDLAALFLIGIIIATARNGPDIFCWCRDLFPGIIAFLIAGFTREAMGYGDGLVILILGLFLGGDRVTCMIPVALLLTVIWGTIHMIRKKKGRKMVLPFVPFLFAADMIFLAGRQFPVV